VPALCVVFFFDFLVCFRGSVCFLVRGSAFEPVPVFGGLLGPSELFTGGATEAGLRVVVGLDAGGSC
jgi:hypothetical protein